MQHLDEGTIHSWLDGALSPDEAARVEAHVAECSQCAIAVAEARGFIAASSRILTALDHVPRGVVPAAPPIKWYNRAAWRAAAAVLVVAVGSLVVRNSDRKAAIATPFYDSVGRANTAVTQPKVGAPSPEATATGELSSRAPANRSIPSAISSGAKLPDKPVAEADLSGKSPRSAKRSDIAVRGEARDEGVSAAIGRTASAPSTFSGALATVPQAAPPSRVEEVAALDAAKGEPPLKVVGAPRVLGARVTLYEVAPGDTVTFTEALTIQLNAVVTTGISSAEPQARRSMEKSAAAAPTQARAPSPTVSPLQVEFVNGVTTISWSDATTGNMLKLSGRMSVERLKEIKRRIEQERAAAAAKKNP